MTKKALHYAIYRLHKNLCDEFSSKEQTMRWRSKEKKASPNTREEYFDENYISGNEENVSEENSEHGDEYWLQEKDPDVIEYPRHSEMKIQIFFDCRVQTGDINGPFATTEIDDESTKFSKEKTDNENRFFCEEGL